MNQRSLYFSAEDRCVRVIDQRKLPAIVEWVELRELADFSFAISQMQVRGAPLIGITAAYGLALALCHDASSENLEKASAELGASRPTAINLEWALQRVKAALVGCDASARAERALAEASAIAEEDVANCSAIGDHGLALLRQLESGAESRERGQPIQVMTHCNAGWLAALEWGTALAPVYKAQQAGLPIHVWVSETRPRNQGVNLTAWELQQAGISHTVIVDNAAGYLMQQGRVDCCLVGSDRTVANGDVCNKVGTYLKALAAGAHGLPFYVALPVSSIDWHCASGAEIPIEERAEEEVLLGDVAGRAYNPAFDVTPAALVTALITEHGVFAAEAQALCGLRAQLGDP
jgi:methylthioribose-1-phosphate isomerase